MPLRLRRGTDAERLTITPAEGELIYTTDEKRIYVGDGTTLGGVALIADSTVENLATNLDLNGFDIVGTGNININGNIIATGDIDGNFIGTFDGDIRGSVFADDSTILVDGLTGNHYGLFNGNVLGNVTGNLFGNVTGNVLGNVTGNLLGNVTGNVTGNVLGNVTGNLLGNVTGNVSGNVDGNFTGSVFTDNSTLVVDGITGFVHANVIISPLGDLKINSLTTGLNQIKLIAENGRSILKLSRGSTSSLAGSSQRYGGILFERDDINGTLTTSAIQAGENFVYITATVNGNINDTTSTLSWTNKRLGLGTLTPTAALDVRGSGVFTGSVSVSGNGIFGSTVTAASFKGSVVGDDSTIIVDAINSTIAVSGTVTAGSVSVSGNGIFGGTVNAASFKGSVVGDDSTIIVDAINSTIAVSGFIQFGSYSKADRDNLGATNGMVLYNTTSNRFQGYQNGAWINLDDGTADP